MSSYEANVIFSGEVQGVGFRFTARSIAETLGLTGYVRNLSDGTVALTAQGEEELTQQLIHELEVEFGCTAEVSWGKPKISYTGFSIAP
jgi:acylphosphatase